MGELVRVTNVPNRFVATLVQSQLALDTYQVPASGETIWLALDTPAPPVKAEADWRTLPTESEYMVYRRLRKSLGASGGAYSPMTPHDDYDDYADDFADEPAPG